MGTIIVNSTITTARSMFRDQLRDISPLHHWGFIPGEGDALLRHRQNRYEIYLRRKFFPGTDPRVLIQVLFRLALGANGIYCITQPDLIHSIPFLKWLFPKRPIVTWVWTREEVREWARYLLACDYVFALTEAALSELHAIGMAMRSSLQIWGCAIDFYTLEGPLRPPIIHDVLLFGLTKRDYSVVRQLGLTCEFKIAASQQSSKPLGNSFDLTILDTNSKANLLHAIHSSHVTIVPLFPHEPQPTGFTNVTESLLCGTSIIIPDCSAIPKTALYLPGVYLYKAGDFSSFYKVVKTALAEAKMPGRRSEIQREAAKVLNGKELNSLIKKVMTGEVIKIEPSETRVKATSLK